MLPVRMKVVFLQQNVASHNGYSVIVTFVNGLSGTKNLVSSKSAMNASFYPNKKFSLDFGTVFLISVKSGKFRKAHYSPPLVDEEYLMLFNFLLRK